MKKIITFLLNIYCIKMFLSVNNYCMTFKLANLLNLFFRLLLIFFLIFIWIRYTVESLTLSIILTVFCTLLTDFLIQYLLNKKKYINSIKASEIKKLKSVINYFIFNENKDNLTFFYNLVSKKHLAVKKNNFIIINHDNDNNVILYPYFTFKNFSVDDLIFILNKTKKLCFSKIVICSNNFDTDCKSFITKIDKNILLLDGEQTYLNLLKPYNCIPENIPNEKKDNQIKFKHLFKNSLSRNKTKSYFFASIILLISSFIIKFNIYYLIISSILLILALISFISPHIKKPLPENIL